MASAGSLFLLLMSSSLLISTVSRPPARNQLSRDSSQKINKPKEGVKAVGKFILNSINELRFTLVPFLGLIPGWGPLISAVTTATLVGVSVVNNNVNNKPILSAIISELDILKSKMEEYHVETKWDNWAAGAYHKPELKITQAWDNFLTLARALLLARDGSERKRQVDEFINNYSKTLDATGKLRTLLTAKGTTFIYNLGDMLAEHVKCHDREIREYTVFINQLICKGNTMNQFYYKQKRLDNPALIEKAAETAYDAANVMFKVQRACMENSEGYVRKDIEALIDNTTTKNRQDLANEVLAFLEKTYDRFDWMVVAYITKNSGHKILETRNKHTLTDFYIYVDRKGVSVAVARQVKGKHTMFNQVSDAIRRCFPKPPVCYQVADKLSKCRQYVESNIPVSETYTVVHAYKGEPHDSFNGKIESDFVYINTRYPAKTPYIYEGNCKKSIGVRGGKFTVLVKSDEEIRNKNPCAKLYCGGNQRGRCELVKGTKMGICHCNMPYYGQHCESSLEDYKRYLQETWLQVVDNRRRHMPRV
uniref:EGF-like domain-containing protein n=1 Tax=Stegastes partitus TaxID=144197 RepID=A0A3B5AHS0_9TELE